MKALLEMSATPAPVTQQSPRLPPATTAPTPRETWSHPAAVSPTMSSTMTIDSTDTFTSSQLRTVIKSGSMAVPATPRAPSPTRSESAMSTSQSLSQYTESYTSGSGSGESSPRSPLTPVFSVANPESRSETESTSDTSSVGTAMPSPVHEGAWGRDAREIMAGIVPLPPPITRRSSTEPSPLSLARNTPIPESPDTSLTDALAPTPGPTTLTLNMMQAQRSPPPTRAEPTVVIPRSPTQPSPTSHQMISPNSPSGMSPDSVDLAMAQNQSLKSAAELIDMELWKVYGRLDGSTRAPEVVGTQAFDGEEGIEIEVESGSSTSASSSSASDDDVSKSETRSAASSEEQEDAQSVVSEMTVMSTQIIGTEGEAIQPADGFELKSLIKTTTKGNSTQIDAVVTRKTVRFAPSVVGGLSPEIPKQILPPMNLSRDSPPLIIPSSAVVHASQPLVRPKSLTIRPSLQTNVQSGSMSPNSSSPSYTPVLQARPSGLVGFPSQPPPLLDNRPPDEFAIIPFHPSMSASHPPPSLHNNPAFGPAPTTSLVRAPWTSSPPQGPTKPLGRQTQHSVDRETAALAQKYSRFAISSLNYMDVEAAKKELRAALALLEGEI